MIASAKAEPLLERLDARACVVYLCAQLQCELADQARRGADDAIRSAGRGTSCAEMRPGKPGERCLRWLMGSICTLYNAR